MEYGRNKIYLVIGIALVLIACLSVGYTTINQSLLTSSLNIDKTKYKWNVVFDSNEYDSIINVGRCKKIKVNGLKIDLGEIKLAKDEKCLYELKIKNEGDVKAKLDDVDITYPDIEKNTSCSIKGDYDTIECGNITYELKQGDVSLAKNIKRGLSVKPGKTITIQIIIKNNGEKEEIQKNAKYKLSFIQREQ